MRLAFREAFRLPVAHVFGYFPTPADWVRLYGFAGTVEDRGDGWYAVPLRRFPFPLVARVDEVISGRRVHWRFRGFWRGEGEVNFEELPDGVLVTGFEDIAMPTWLGLGPWIERHFLEDRFRRLWASGWRRLRQQESTV